MTCSECGGEVNVRGTGWAQKVTGWEVKRRSGGANQITHPTRLNEFLCPTCVIRLKTLPDQHENQGSLL